MPRSTLIGVIGVLAYPLLWIIYDVVLIVRGIEPISTAMLRIWGDYPIVAFLLGMGIGALMVHFGWSQARGGGLLMPPSTPHLGV